MAGEIVWKDEKVCRIFIGEEPVKEKIGAITVEDILEVKAQKGFQVIVVLDKESNKALTKSDFPFEGDVVILPVYKAGAF